MTASKKLFHSLTMHMHEDSPEVIMKKLNGAINDDNKMFMFVTVFIGVLDLETGHLSYCNGGHDAPLLIGEGVSQLPVKPNFPVGLRPRVKFEAQETDIEPNTTIFLYTDGLTEAKDADKQLYGKERLMKLADNLLVKDQIPKRLIEKTLESVTTFVGEAEQSDDLTLLAIRYFGKQS
jgi:sigma-B regulation protein RsbU (phosphoserine phosphatase)